MSDPSLYGPQQSRFARLLERRELRRPDQLARGLRARLLSGLHGRVIEIGCGDGRAFEHYPPEVEAVLALEPDPVARATAEQRASEASVPIEVIAGIAEKLPAQDRAFDAAVAVWVLCTVPDPATALREIGRVLAPSGEFRFYEHVRSPHVMYRGLQHAIDSLLWTRALGGCRTTRDTESMIRARRLPLHLARTRLPLLITTHHHLSPIHPRHRPTRPRRNPLRLVQPMRVIEEEAAWLKSKGFVGWARGVSGPSS
jgi:SAM-dependent methyltransferase